MQTQTLSPELSQALYKIVHYQTSLFRNSDIYCILKGFLMEDAERGFGTYLFEVLPQLDNIFEFIEKAAQELDECLYQVETPERRAEADFQVLVDWIVSLCSPTCIYRVDSCNMGHEDINLLIVIPLNESTTFKEMKKWIHTINTKKWKINYSLYQITQLRKYIEAGSIFHINACKKENLIYDSGAEPLPSPEPENFLEAQKKANTVFAQGFKRSSAFMEGARIYMEKRENSMAAFMLHQATELTLHTVLQAITGMYFRDHSIRDLLKYCDQVTHQLKGIFSKDPVDTLLLRLLDEAYVNGRYNVEFVVKAAELTLLYEKVDTILDKVCRYVSETLTIDAELP
ncbi:MAG TPA: HEPN domain-containing protein [Edaphocola sp.]|nr:HEPN domain-containing protein [Edaphocola sp.]